MRIIRFAAASIALWCLACAHDVVRVASLDRMEEQESRFDSPDAAAEYYAMKRRPADPEADARALYRIARERAAEMRLYSTRLDAFVPGVDRLSRASNSLDRTTGTWTALGPGNIGGRMRALVIDAEHPGTMLAGGVSGGVWKTTDGGSTWRPVGDELANLAVNSLVVDTGDSRTVYAGTGEGYFREEVRGTGLPLRGEGIFVSRDDGETWVRLESTAGSDFFWVNDLAVSHLDPSRIYAATRTGVWRSTDRGTTWTRTLETNVKGGCLDLALRTDGATDSLFASCGTLDQATVYRHRQAEGAGSWETVLSEPGMGRTSLAIAPSRQSVVYALSASNESGPDGHHMQGFHAVYRSVSNGDAGSWSARATKADANIVNSLLLTNAIVAVVPDCDPRETERSWVTMGWYVNVIAVDPLEPDRVFAGGVDLFRSDDGGRTWGPASYWWPETDLASYAHADQHGIYFHPGYDGAANQTMFLLNDGGVYRTDNARGAIGRGLESLCNPETSRVQFRSLNHNLGVTQFYHGVALPGGREWFGGTQDNGTVLGSSAGGINGWTGIFGGDGGYVAFDPNDPKTLYVESQRASIHKSVDGGRNFERVTTGIDDPAVLFITPLTMDPNASNRLWIGGRQLWRTDNGAGSWVAASAILGDGSISAIAVTPGDSDRVVAGTTGGSIYRSDRSTSATGSTVWQRVRPRAGFVSSITFDPSHAGLVFATYAGFGGGPHVWRSRDGGTTWAAIDGSGSNAIPDIPVHCVVPDPYRDGRLFAGTDLGVFVSIDEGASWAVEDSGFPNVVTESLAVGWSEEGPMLFAFTHGRGAWSVELYTPGPRRRAIVR